MGDTPYVKAKHVQVWPIRSLPFCFINNFVLQILFPRYTYRTVRDKLFMNLLHPLVGTIHRWNNYCQFLVLIDPDALEGDYSNYCTA